ncbi:MAG: hypothetical protein RIR39_2316 [Pseudomonadota bacterium]
MFYDGSEKLRPAIASLCGLSIKSQVQIAALIKQAKIELGITSKSKNLPNEVKLAIYQWHYNRLNPVQDIKQAIPVQNEDIQDNPEPSLPNVIVQNVKQADDAPLELPLDDAVQDVKQDESVQDSPITQSLPTIAVQDVKQTTPVQIDDEDSDNLVYDFKQIHFAITISHKEHAKRTTVMLEGYLVKALQRKHNLADNTAIRTWIEQAIKADGERFDSFAPLTRQVKRIIIESFID